MDPTAFFSLGALDQWARRDYLRLGERVSDVELIEHRQAGPLRTLGPSEACSKPANRVLFSRPAQQRPQSLGCPLSIAVGLQDPLGDAPQPVSPDDARQNIEQAALTDSTVATLYQRVMSDGDDNDARGSSSPSP